MYLVSTIIAFSVLSSVSEPATGGEPKVEINMEYNIPKLSFPLRKLIVPAFESVSKTLAKATRKKIYEYSIVFSTTLMRHFGGETEVQILDGELTSGSRMLLLNLETDMETLQYGNQLENILDTWRQKLCGEPARSEEHDIINDYVKDIIKEFEGFILLLQKLAINKRRAIDNTLCKKVCNSKSRILNLTTANIPADLERALANGTNFVPLEVMNIDEIKGFIEKDLITSTKAL